MFGRRRRRVAASSALSVAPVPMLHDEQIFDLLHERLRSLVGEQGAWTLVPRGADDTEVIFHGLKAREIATELAQALITEQAALRGETSGAPTALSWTPVPITTWSEPAPSQNLVAGATSGASASAGADSTIVERAETSDDELAAASAAWIEKASATLSRARFVA